MRLTKIICTLGPATNTAEGIRKLAENGMNIARLNFSHGTHATHLPVVRLIKELNEREDRHIGLLLDTKGAEIRTGERTEPLQITAGDTVVFSHKGSDPTLPVIAVNYAEFSKDVKDAEYIIVDNGDMIFDVLEIAKDRVTAKARDTGSIGSRRHVNLPGADVSLPSVTEQDWEDIRLACEEKMDFIALSFIRSGEEIEEVRAFTRKHGHPEIQLIAKIENAIAVRNIAGIVAAADGVMVARGDLGSEIPLHTLPAVQDDIVERCRTASKPVIVATHMLESMIKNPLPTRAEVTDVAYAAKTGADSTMLSGETAAGKHPFDALRIMGDILEETEKHLLFVAPSSPGSGQQEAQSAAAVSMANAQKAPAIALFTRSGSTARAISHLRPTVPVIAFTDQPDVARRMQLLFGIHPVVLSFEGTPEQTVMRALAQLHARFDLPCGAPVAVLSTIHESGQNIHTVQSRIIP